MGVGGNLKEINKIVRGRRKGGGRLTHSGTRNCLPGRARRGEWKGPEYQIDIT